MANDCSDTPDIIKVFQKDIKIKLSHFWDEKTSTNNALKKMLLNLWDPNHDQRLSTTVETVLRHIAVSMDSAWQKAIETGSWSPLFTALFGTNNPSKKFELKRLLPDAISRAGIAMHKLISMTLKYNEEIKQLNDKCDIWSLEFYYKLFLFVQSVWPHYFTLYWKPSSLVDHKYISSKDGLSTEIAFWGWMMEFGITHPDKYLNREKYVEAGLPIKAWSFKSCLPKIPCPEAFKWDEIEEIEWIDERSGDTHPTKKNSTLGMLVGTTLYVECADAVAEAHGNSHFKNNGGFLSELFHASTIETGVAQMYKNYDYDHEVISDEMDEKCRESLNNLVKHDKKLGSNYPILNISRYSGEMIDSGIIHVHILFKLCSNSVQTLFKFYSNCNILILL